MYIRIQRLNILILVSVCIGYALLAIPTITNNIDDPNAIIYFDNDEGYLMDLIWSYYTGEIRDSYTGDVDYGIEMLYLSDLVRLIFSRFIDFTPGSFVLILRWIHFLSWIGAFIALWIFVGKHFGRGWKQTMALLLLASRPAFSYFTNNLKPDPLVLLLIIIGLDYTLCLVEKPSRKYFVIATLCASLAFMIKFAGIFLVPAIIAGIYIGERYQREHLGRKQAALPQIRCSWLLEAAIGLCLIALPFIFIRFYVRKSTGYSYYEEFGLIKSLTMHTITKIVLFAGLSFILLAVCLYFLSRRKSFLPTSICNLMEINSNAFLVSGPFALFSVLLGLRWISKPVNFITTYSHNFFDFAGVFEARRISEGNVVANFTQGITNKFLSFDILLLLLFVFYLTTEIFSWLRCRSTDVLFYKRMTLLIFLVPFLFAMLSIGRFTQHHSLPFLVAIIALVVHSVDKIFPRGSKKMLLKIIAISLISLLLIIDIVYNGAELIKSRMYQFGQKYDVAFDIAEWINHNISENTIIAAEKHTKVYIPLAYRNIKVYTGYQLNRVEQLRHLVDMYQPRYIYYNEGPSGGEPMPEIKEILPDKEVRLVKSFDSAGRRFQRKRGDRFLIYEILH